MTEENNLEQHDKRTGTREVLLKGRISPTLRSFSKLLEANGMYIAKIVLKKRKGRRHATSPRSSVNA